MRWYWFRLGQALPVTFHLASDHRVLWQRIYGVQIGWWFIGAVQAAHAKEDSQHAQG